MLAAIRQYWAMVPGSIAGPAFIASAIVSAIGAVLAVMLGSIFGRAGSEYWALETLGWLLAIISNLALLAGLAATYNRWTIILDSLGRLGLLLAAIGTAVLIIIEALFIATGLIPFIVTGSPAYSYSVPSIAASIGDVLDLAYQVAHFVFSAGMALAGIYVLRAKANLLPGRAKSLPIIIGLWSLFQYFLFARVMGFIRTIIPAGTPLEMGITWVAGLEILRIVLLVLLGFAFLSKQSTLPLEAEPAPGAFEAPLEHPGEI